jgi:hypothetical protein
MHHSAEQLDALWAALKGGDTGRRQELLQRYANGAMPGVLPEIVRDDAQGQVLSIPTPDHPGRHVYERRPGGSWSEQR